MTEYTPLVDCCHVEEADRVPRAGVSPFVIHPDPLKRPLSRRRMFRKAGAATAATAAVVAAACGSDDTPSANNPSPAAGGSSPAAGAAVTTQSGQAAATTAPTQVRVQNIEIPYCSQILCGVPLETAVKRGFFEEEGLRVKLVYMRGGALAVQALLGGSADWVGAAMDVVVSANGTGKNPLMVASISSLPFFALVTAPKSSVATVADLKGKRIGVANLNTSDHLLARYLLEKNGVDDAAANFAPLGPNLFDGLRTGQVDAGLVQEPALSLLTDQGSKVLVNFMKRSDVDQYLGGPYQFVGLNTRPDVIEKNPDTLKKIIAALTKANAWVRANPGSEIVKNLPEELVAGGDLSIFARSLDAVKNDLYPASLALDRGSVQRVIDVQKAAGALERDVNVDNVFTNKLIGA